MSSVHTIFANYDKLKIFSETNLKFIQGKITEILSKEYKQKIMVPLEDIKIEMEKQWDARIEPIPEMNRRVAMQICASFREWQAEIERSNYFQSTWRAAWNRDPILGIKPYDTHKMNENYHGHMFAFTY